MKHITMLMWSETLGLREMHTIYGSEPAPGSLMRDREGLWFMRAFPRRHMQINQWRAVSVEELPAKIKAEALIMGITL